MCDRDKLPSQRTNRQIVDIESQKNQASNSKRKISINKMNWPDYTPSSPEIVEFMNTAAKALGVQSLPEPKDIFAFGEANRRVTGDLNKLALAGIKRATTSFPVPNPRHWDVGDLSVGLDEFDKPCFLMKTTELVEKNFEDVDYEFAFTEGEGDKSLEFWRSEHRHCYKDKMGPDGRLFGDGIGRKVLCERYEIIFSVSKDWKKAA